MREAVSQTDAILMVRSWTAADRSCFLL